MHQVSEGGTGITNSFALSLHCLLPGVCRPIKVDSSIWEKSSFLYSCFYCSVSLLCASESLQPLMARFMLWCAGSFQEDPHDWPSRLTWCGWEAKGFHSKRTPLWRCWSWILVEVICCVTFPGQTIKTVSYSYAHKPIWSRQLLGWGSPIRWLFGCVKLTKLTRMEVTMTKIH